MNSPDPDRWMDARLEAYLDGDLRAAERRRFERLLAEHPAWQAELRRARRIQKTLRATSTPPCPPRVTRAVLQQTSRPDRTDRAPRPHRVRRTRWWQPVLAAGLLLLAVALAPLISPPPDAPQPFEASRYTKAEIHRAAAEARWTLAYVAAIGEKTSRTLRQDVLEAHVAEPLQNALRTALLESISTSYEEVN